jgi:hypothetical protein
MVVYYALGGGLGHLTRARRVLATLRLDSDAVLMTASRYAQDPRVTGGLPVVEVPRRLGHDRAGFRGWLAGTLAELAPAEVIIDTFPGGILGELCGLELPPARLVARRLRWSAYRGRLAGPLPAYEVAYLIEPLSTPHADVLTSIARRVERLPLVPCRLASAAPLHPDPHVAVVHTGPGNELGELIELAHGVRPGPRVRLVIVSPRRPDRLRAGAVWCDLYPAAPHLHHAEVIVTAAGWAVMQDTEHVRDRHRFVPFPRPLDDQFWRARWALARAADRATATL